MHILHSQLLHKHGVHSCKERSSRTFSRNSQPPHYRPHKPGALASNAQSLYNSIELPIAWKISLCIGQMLTQAASLPQHSHVLSPGPAVELEHHNNSDFNPLMDQMLVREAAIGSSTWLEESSAHHHTAAMAAETGDQVHVPVYCGQHIH